MQIGVDENPRRSYPNDMYLFVFAGQIRRPYELT